MAAIGTLCIRMIMEFCLYFSIVRPSFRLCGHFWLYPVLWRLSACSLCLFLSLYFPNARSRRMCRISNGKSSLSRMRGMNSKTPLTSIATSADVLAMEYDGNEWIQNIQKQTQRLSKLVGNLVALSRLDEERPFPDKAKFSLTDAAWEISESLPLWQKPKEKYFLRISKTGCRCWGIGSPFCK